MAYKNPGVAAVLSAVIPGLGQFYDGDFLRGIFWLIVTPGLWIGIGGLFGWVCHVIAAMTAHRRARLKNSRSKLTGADAAVMQASRLQPDIIILDFGMRPRGHRGTQTTSADQARVIALVDLMRP